MKYSRLLKLIDQWYRKPAQYESKARLMVQQLEDRAVPAAFQGLGFYGATAISGDGTTVIGGAIRWTEATGPQLLGNQISINSSGVSADGSVVTGQYYNGGHNNAGEYDNMFIWTASQGLITEATPNASNTENNEGRVNGTSGDGSVVVGTYSSAAPEANNAFRWTASTGFELLPHLSNSGYSGLGFGVSADGSTVVGLEFVNNGSGIYTYASRWTAATGMINLGTLGNLAGGSINGSEALATSADGSVVVGDSASAGQGSVAREAFLWAANGGMMPLGVLPGGSFTSQATGVSANGSVVIGTSDSSTGQQPFIWDPTNKMRSLQSVLVADGLASGWRLTSATGISADGMTIVGNGVDPQGRAESWIAHLNAGPALVAPASLQWNSIQGGANVSYSVSGSATTSATTVELFWSTGSRFADVIGGPIAGASQVVSPGTSPGNYGPFTVPASLLGTPPPGATYLLAVADPDDILGNFDPNTNVTSLSVPSWTGAGVTDLWSDGDNWLAGSAPTPGSALVFPAGGQQETSNNDLGFTFGPINISDDYCFSGESLKADSLSVTQGSPELDFATTVTRQLSLAANATLTVGSGTAAGSLILPVHATLSLNGRLVVSTNATLEDNGTLTVVNEGSLDDFGAVNIDKGGLLAVSQGRVLIGFNATFSNSGLVTLDTDASLADEGTLSVVNNGSLFTSGTISVGECAVLNLSSGGMVEAPSSVMVVDGNEVIGLHFSLSIGGTSELAGTDNGIDKNPANNALVSTLITDSTTPATKMLLATHQAAANAADVFDTAEVLAKDAANKLPADVAQAAERLASFAKGASHFALATQYAEYISDLITAYNGNDQEAFGNAWANLTEQVNSDICGLAIGGIVGYVTAATSIADGGASAVAIPFARLLGQLGGSLIYRKYFDDYLRLNVQAQGRILYTALKNGLSTAPAGAGGTLNDQGSVTVGPTGTQSDQDAIVVGKGATLTVFGNLIEGASGSQQVYGTLVVEPVATLSIIGSLTIEPGGTFLPFGTVNVEPGGIANLPSGVSAFASNLFIVGGQCTNDRVLVEPMGVNQMGSTGIKVNASLNGAAISEVFDQGFRAIYILGYAGNDIIQLDGIAVPTNVAAGGGNDTIQLGDGNNRVTLGDGNDSVYLGDGDNIVALGDGNDNISAGNGNDSVTLGNGNDGTQLDNGNNVVVEGNGHDTVSVGNGDNIIVAGLGQPTVQAGNGNNILIDGSAQLIHIGDSFRLVLTDWIAGGGTATSVASIRSRLAVIYNTTHHNILLVGTGLDWFFVTDTGDKTNRKPTDIIN